MSNDSFDFRHFSMRQAPSGQRLNTDSCVFGGIIGTQKNPRRIVDIGSGTGIVALMLASRFPEAQIIAVEPEDSIAAIAEENMRHSPWRDRLTVRRCRAQDMRVEDFGTFDFVVCNPPYFQNSTLSNDRLRAVARHTTDLSPLDIFSCFKRLLDVDGSAWLSCPTDDQPSWFQAAEQVGFFCIERIHLQDHPNAKAHVTILGWSLQKPVLVKEQAVTYRTGAQGPRSPWMRAFRNEWYPAQYND